MIGVLVLKNYSFSFQRDDNLLKADTYRMVLAENLSRDGRKHSDYKCWK